METSYVLIHAKFAYVSVPNLSTILDTIQIVVAKDYTFSEHLFASGVPAVYVVGQLGYKRLPVDHRFALDAVAEVKERYPKVKVIAWQEPEYAEEFLRAGADDFLSYDPTRDAVLAHAIQKYLPKADPLNPR